LKRTEFLGRHQHLRYRLRH